MRKHVIFAAALWVICPATALAQIDPDWSRREMERMQAEQERFNAQVERQRAEQERFNAQVERQRAQQERFISQHERQRGQQERGGARGSGGGFNWLDALGISPNRRREKAVGKLLAAGDCAGAEKYALENGEFELLDRVKEHCEQPTSMVASRAAHETNWLLLAGEVGGFAFYADPDSIRDQGTHVAYWSRIMFPPDNLLREIRTLNFYRCRERTNAIKYMIVYSRDGTVENIDTEDRDLKFEPLEPKTDAEQSLYNSACAPRSASK